MEQIRIHGRGGQGVVTAAELIAIAAFYDGKQAQAFPSFGAERSGAPLQSFVRLSNQPIVTREQIYQPTVLIIQDPTLINTTDIFYGTDKDTLIIINSPKNNWPDLKKKYSSIFCSSATAIALKIFGKNIVNTIILGAFARQTKLISLASLKKAIREKFADKGSEMIAKNIKAVELAYNNKSL